MDTWHETKRKEQKGINRFARQKERSGAVVQGERKKQ